MLVRIHEIVSMYLCFQLFFDSSYDPLILVATGMVTLRGARCDQLVGLRLLMDILSEDACLKKAKESSPTMLSMSAKDFDMQSLNRQNMSICNSFSAF